MSLENINNLEIEDQIKNVLFTIIDESNHGNLNGDKQWTRRIKELLGELGESLHFGVCAGGFQDRFHREWVHDLVWFQESEDRFLIRVPLVVESEWGRTLNHIKYDFEKLLMSNADLRLMICQAKPNQLEVFQNYFRKAISDYTHLNKGAKFIIAILDDYESGEFIFETIKKQ
jgi:hypothetical protein